MTRDNPPGIVSSVPKPIEVTGPIEWPEELDEEPIFSKGLWSGIEQWICLWKTKHIAAQGNYELPCRKTFWSNKELMAHIQDDH